MSASELLLALLLGGTPTAAVPAPRAVAAAAPLPAVPLPSVPTPMAVPEGLRSDFPTLEPSGLVWVPALARYLVVSDDAGPKGQHHRPWLLAMDAEGRLDREPVVVRGIDELDDAESICAAPDGRLLVATSHSQNKKGKTPPERRQLLLLKVEGRALTVEGRLDLTTARGPKGESLLALAGMAEDGRLDLEAMGCGGDRLLLGLKSPLTAQGEAVVLELARPLEALKAGAIPAGAVRRLGAVRLTVTTPEGPVQQGISDLLPLADGSLLLLANSPKGMPADGGGALHRWVPKTGEVQLLQRFPGLKPEGIARESTGRGLVLVFDPDRAEPRWMVREQP